MPVRTPSLFCCALAAPPPCACRHPCDSLTGLGWLQPPLLSKLLPSPCALPGTPPCLPPPPPATFLSHCQLCKPPPGPPASPLTPLPGFSTQWPRGAFSKCQYDHVTLLPGEAPQQGPIALRTETRVPTGARAPPNLANPSWSARHQPCMPPGLWVP